jgi:hypothetical protein
VRAILEQALADVGSLSTECDREEDCGNGEKADHGDGLKREVVVVIELDFESGEQR